MRNKKKEGTFQRDCRFWAQMVPEGFSVEGHNGKRDSEKELKQ